MADSLRAAAAGVVASALYNVVMLVATCGMSERLVIVSLCLSSSAEHFRSSTVLRFDTVSMLTCAIVVERSEC